MGVSCWLPLLLLPVRGFAAEPDSVITQLQEVVVSSSGGRAARVTSDGNLRVSTQSLQRGMRVMGEADIIGALKRSAGVSSVGDYGSGPIILGSDPSQSVFRINGAPVFFPYRFGGIFSTFNSSHFLTMEVMRFGRKASAPNRLGAVIDLTPDLQYDRTLSGALNVGLLSSSLNLKGSAAQKFALTLSGRISYVDQLYGPLLNSDKNAMSYNFHDINASAGWRIDSLNTISGDFFTNSDNIYAGNNNYAMNTRLSWRNNVGSLRWQNAGRFAPVVAAFYSEISSRLSVTFPQYDVIAPNGMQALGLSGSITPIRGHGFVPSVETGAEIIGYTLTPLHARMEGTLARPAAPYETCRRLEGRVFADALFAPTQAVSFSAGLTASLFGHKMFAIDPRATATLNHRGNRWAVSVGRFTQYLHNVGFSEIGLASNFWYPAGKDLKPQNSVDFTASWWRAVCGNMLELTASAYYKIVGAQSEYYGQILDIIDNDFDISSHIATSNGYNLGVEAGVQKRYGALTGSITYAFSRAMRRNALTGTMFHALTDAGHQLKADAEYVFNEHWSVAAGFIYASGRVYTPTRYLYIISNRLITEYGDRNSARLPDYQRLDLSATYRFRTHGRLPLTHTINLSIINAYGHKNVESQYFSIQIETLRYKLYRVHSMYRFLPSISYSIDF